MLHAWLPTCVSWMRSMSSLPVSGRMRPVSYLKSSIPSTLHVHTDYRMT